jgi:hypothetical protein
MGRTFLAGIVLVFGAGFLIPSDGTLAKGVALSGKPSGLFVKHGLPFRGNAAHKSVFLPPIVPPLNIFNSGAAPRRYSYPVSRYRRVFGDGLPAAGIGVYYGSYGVMPDVSDCTSQQVIVPSEDGGERRVTIYRC